ncbi:hypothetical protein Pla52o_53570 [Novipirellula galeiformis]|uniref:Uncharacterized protein n=1 Tax=Novipirellula galeiformis TaxID=2528004 RepID=A0A5C6BZA3_9BACT|nr:hypothetical protein [Novipirellula galeiformis]TWU17182.1 hypothetical protein Pla52o_53570 [Novipirellula galeiformis]
MSGLANRPPSVPEDDASDRVDDHEGVPASERGKEERMSFDETQPSAVFGIVGASYLVILFLVLIAAAVYWWK